MKPLNNKIFFELLDEKYQPKKSILVPDGDILKKAKVLDIGDKVTNIKKGDEIVLYVNDIRGIGDRKGYCNDTNPIFINDKPQPNKTHISKISSDNLTKFDNGKVISSTDNNLKKMI